MCVISARGAFFPLDERLQLGEHSWTPQSIKEAVGLGVEIASYRRAAERFEALTKLGLSKSSLQRLTDEAGQVVVERQKLEAEAMVKAPDKRLRTGDTRPNGASTLFPNDFTRPSST